MSDEFKSSRLRWARAQEHIIDLEKRIRVFFDTKPYTAVVEPDSDGIYELHKVKFIKPIPDNLAIVTTEAVEHLRAALDHAGFAVAKAASGTDRIKNAYFPFAENLSQLEKKFIGKGKSKDIPEEIRPLFLRFKPYKGGNHLLWALNRMCNTNKHTMLVPVACFCRKMSFFGMVHSTELDLPTFCSPPVWDRCKQEVILFRSKLNIKVDYDTEVTFNIVFDDVEGVSGQPVVPILNKFVCQVDGILTAIEAEARRLGIVS